MANEKPIYPAPRQDPVTGEPLLITRLEGPTTGITLEGRFSFGVGSRLDALSAEHRAFVEVFIKNRGIIKDVEGELGISYPTVRARLDDVIRAMGYAPYGGTSGTGDTGSTSGESDAALPPSTPAPPTEDERRALLADVAAGRISAAEAATYLRGEMGFRARRKPTKER